MSTAISEITSDCVVQANGSAWVAVECEIEEIALTVVPDSVRNFLALQWTYAGLDAIAHAAKVRAGISQ